MRRAIRSSVARQFGRTIGPRLQCAREATGCSVAELAALIGCDVSTIARIEYGARVPSIGLLVRLARELEVSTDYLLGLK